MRYVAWLLFPVIIIVSFINGSLSFAQDPITISNPTVSLNFPNSLTFNAHITANSEIEQVVLEYGVNERTCGTVIAKAFPTFTPGNAVDVAWTWEMKKSGSEPPGATIWYRWQVTDKNGIINESPKATVLWLDDQHPWTSITSDMLTLHWYNGSSTFANDLLTSAVDSLHQLSKTTGVVPDAPIDLYIYGNYADLHKATLYQAGWTGGLAYPNYNITLIGISSDQETWGKRAEAHELTHVLVGHLVAGCVTQVPTWLNEGLAVYGEGGPQAESLAVFNAAVATDALLPIHVISGNFSEVSSAADLAYSESYSIVKYLITQYGQSRMLGLLNSIRQGMVIEDALHNVYGFGLNELETRWRISIGLHPAIATMTAPTVSPSATAIPTYQLYQPVSNNGSN